MFPASPRKMDIASFWETTILQGIIILITITDFAAFIEANDCYLESTGKWSLLSGQTRFKNLKYFFIVTT